MSDSQHWLINVAHRAGLPGVSWLIIPASTPIQEAWDRLCAASGRTADEIADEVARYFRLPVARLDSLEPRAQKLVPEALAQQYLVFPLREDDRALAVACCDPMDLDAEKALQFASGRRVALHVATPEAIRALIVEHYGSDRSLEALLDRVDAEFAGGLRIVEHTQVDSDEVDDRQTAPVIKLTNLILREAIERRASDIHLEPAEDAGVVRLRVDGVLRQHMRLPLPALRRITSRLKILGEMNIADRLRPQDGATQVELNGRSYNLRISTVPAQSAEKVVVRVLSTQGVQRLNDLNLSVVELTRMRSLLSAREGIVIVTGPTGSGKTTTIYGALVELITGKINITSVEDPVEYRIPGITQIEVEPKQGVTFASALRAILRQDPDVIYVGEIRDQETAEMAVHASLTGHLVLTTLHANSAVAVVQRLQGMGLSAANIAATLRGVVSQRLARQLCPACAVPIEGPLTEEEGRLARRYGAEPVRRAVGCRQCDGTGYRGRLPLQEVLHVNPQFQRAVMAGAPPGELELAAVAGGMRPIQEVARERVRQGHTSLQEIERVLGMVAEEQRQTRRERPHLLLVDDDPENRILGRALLEGAGLEVSEAADGVEALERIHGGGEFDLVVLDLDMPRLDGREVLHRLRGSVATATLPVVILTGSIDPEAEARLMEEGADDYIRKPLDPARFMARIRAALRRAGS